MRRLLLSGIVFWLFLLTAFSGLACDKMPAAGNSPTPEIPGKNYQKGGAKMVFNAVRAGQFYPGNSIVLQQKVDEYIKNASIPADLGDIFGLVAPHAGYEYSGPVAGYSYRSVQGKQYDLIVIMGLSHFVPGAISVLDYDAYRTPLGEIQIDREANHKLLETATFVDNADDMFAQEHSMEVQLPFIQHVLPNTKVMLIAIGQVRRQMLTDLAKALDKVFAGRHVLFVASTDMSHFRTYEAAKKIDTTTLDFLAHGDIEGLYRAPEYRERMCGLSPVTVLFELYKLRGGNQIRVLTYKNSGDTAGDKSRVVGYGSIALLNNAAADSKKNADPAGTDAKQLLSTDDKKLLLKIARETMEQYVKTGKKPDFKIASPALLADGAAFVTLTKKSGNELRGCIGHIIATLPLWECVREMAVAAATQDPRFSPVRPNELDGLHVEISVLTPPVKVKDVSEIQVGVHGLIMSKGFYRGVLLPQVPTEYGWDRNTFLDQTCMKAGMRPGCWRDTGTTIEKFSAIVFSE